MIQPHRAGSAKRLLAYIIEDATLIKLPAEGITRLHVRFKGDKTETLTTLNPKSSGQQIKTPPMIVHLVDKLLDDHIYAGIADILNEQGLRPGGSARPGRGQTCFTALRVAYLVHTYALRSRYDWLRDRGMLTKAEAATRLGIHEATIVPWGTRHHQTARLQWTRVPLRVATFYADQALQSLGPALKSSSAFQNRGRIKTFRCNRKKYSVKPVTWNTERIRRGPRQESSAHRLA